MILANEAFRRLTQIPTPRTRFRRLQVNGGDYGVFVELERIGGKFLDRHRRDREAPMYEADPVSGMLRTGIGSLVPLYGGATYDQGYQKKSGPDEHYDDLAQLIEGVLLGAHESGDSCPLHEALNLELYLDYLAVMALIQSHDHVRKNFYLSRQRDAAGKERWEFYPWDLDLTFGCLYTDEHTVFCKTFTATADPFFGQIPEGVELEYPTPAVYNLLIDLIHRDGDLRAELERRVCGMLASGLWTSLIFDMIDAYEEELLPELESDSWDDLETTAEFAAAVEEVRSFVTLRAKHLSGLLGCRE
jgi:hypothetical protein